MVGGGKIKEVFMLAGGDSGCYVGKTGSSQDMKNCADRLTREKQKPYGLGQYCLSEPGNVACVRKVVELQDCSENKVYDNYLWFNEDSARMCAHALMILTGIKHEALLSRARWVLSDIFQVKKAE